MSGDSDYIPRGAPGSYDGLCIYPGAYPVQRQGEIRVYYGGSNGKHSGFRDGFFCMARLRPDGYAGLASEGREAKWELSKLIRSNASERNCILRPMPREAALRASRYSDQDGFAVDDCQSIVTNCTDQVVHWRTKANLSDFLGKYFRLRFEATGAKLYSFAFGGD